MKKLRRITLPILIFTLILSSFAYGQEAENMTRGNFTKEILKTMEVEVEEGLDLPFKDIANEEDIPYIASAFNKKIVKGDGENFYPEHTVTKEEAVIMLVRALGVLNVDLDEASKTEINFSDAEEISPWARSFISYAVKYGIIENSVEDFQPKKQLTTIEANEMLNNFKTAFVRDGLTAAELLHLADNHLKNQDTYKFKGLVDMVTEVTLPTEEGAELITEVMEIKTEQEGSFKTPDTVYLLSKAITDITGELVEETSEVYMEDNIMYTRAGETEDWMKMDLTSIMEGLESSIGGIDTEVTDPEQGFAQFSEAELELFGLYARYGEDVEIDGKEYYLVKIDLDSDAFMEIYTEIMDQAMEQIIKGIEVDENLQNEVHEESFEDMMVEAINQTIENMNVEMVQEYYIDKEDKSYSKLNLKQITDTHIENVQTKVDMDASFEYYGFGEEVTFPEITGDIIEMDF